MPFEHACFVSYRHHPQSKPYGQFIEIFCAEVSGELDMLLAEKLYIDSERLHGGEFFKPKIAEALCKSICMIVVFTPTYFHPKSTFCAREYFAMEQLERKRLARLEKQRGVGLILPVVLRGVEELPEGIRERHYYDCQDISGRHLTKRLSNTAQQIAKVIYERAKLLAPIADELTCDCNLFEFPSEEEVRARIASMTSPATRFPLR
jgi:hypothetical protein